MKKEEFSKEIKKLNGLCGEISSNGDKINDILDYMDRVFQENKSFFNDTMTWMQAVDKDNVRLTIPAFKLDPNNFEETNAIGQLAVVEFGDIIKDATKLTNESNVLRDDFNNFVEKMTPFIRSLHEFTKMTMDNYAFSDSVDDKLKFKTKKLASFESDVSKMLIAANKFETKTRIIKDRVNALRGVN